MTTDTHFYVTKKFDPEFLREDILWTFGEDILEDETVETHRWYDVHRLVFRHEGRIWETEYSQGLTEIQDIKPWEDESEVTCYEVEPYERTITDYRRVLSD